MGGYEVVLAEAALEDLAAIRKHVAITSSPQAADRLLERIFDHLDGLATTPMRGTSRQDIRPGLRTMGWRRTLTIAVWVDEAARRAVVVGVFFRGRDVASALRKRGGDVG